MNRSHHRCSPVATLITLVCALALVAGAVAAPSAHAGSPWAPTDLSDTIRNLAGDDEQRSAYVADRLLSPFSYERSGEAAQRWRLPSVDRMVSGDASGPEYRLAFLGTGIVTGIAQAATGQDPPELSFPGGSYANGVNPNSASRPSGSSATFTFRVDYEDPEDDPVTAPSTAELRIFTNSGLTGTPYATVSMSLISGSVHDGTYQATRALEAGSRYWFQFRFVSGNSGLTARLTGPDPVTVNARPNITDQTDRTSFTPAMPVTDTNAQIIFECIYQDDDGDAPTVRQVEVVVVSPADGSFSTLSGSPFTMSTTGPFDYVGGQTYRATVSLPAGGTYRYRFRFNDGWPGDSDTLDPQFIYHPEIVVPSSPILLNGHHTPDPPTNIEEPTLVTFRVTYKEADGDLPKTGMMPAQQIHRVHVYYYKESEAGGLSNPLGLVAYDEADHDWPPPHENPLLYGRSNPYPMSGAGAWRDSEQGPLLVRQGVQFSTTVALHRPGLYFYAFEFENENNQEIWFPRGADPTPRLGGPTFSDFVQSEPIDITRHPTLSFPPAPYNDGANIDDGDGDPTTVTFRIIYTDLDNLPPTLRQVRIYTDSALNEPWGPGDPGLGAGVYNMQKISGNPRDGEVYSRTLDLPSSPPGTFFYYFLFDNEHYFGETQVLRRPPRGAVPDYMKLILVNRPPILSDYSLAPTFGGQADEYTFRVTYTDYDNDPPADTDESGNPVVLLNVDQLDHNNNLIKTRQLDMQRVSGDPPNWAAGEEFEIKARGISPDPNEPIIGDGRHRFWFEASDGRSTTIFPSNAATTPGNRLVGPHVNDPPNPVTGGFDPPDGTELESTDNRPEISWNAGSDPNPLNTPATLRYRVELSNDNFASIAREFETNANQTSWQVTPALTRGDWWYRIITIDPYDEESAPSNEITFRVNARPTLADGVVDPEYPDPEEDWLGAGEGDNFTFSAVYRDLDGDAPDTIRVTVWNEYLNRTVTHDLTRVSGAAPNYVRGEEYSVTLTGADIGPGDNRFYFEATDGIEMARHPVGAPADRLPGPFVNDPPHPVTSGFDPAAGDALVWQPERIRWDRASDPNATDPPSSLRYLVQFSRWSNNWDADPNVIELGPTAPGVTRIDLPPNTLEPGTWYYRVITVDQGLPARGIEGAETASVAVEFNIARTPPTLTLDADPWDDGVDPNEGLRGDTFTFKINYQDDDNEPPFATGPDGGVRLWVRNITTGEERDYPMVLDQFGGAPDYLGGELFKIELTGAPMSATSIGGGEHEFYFTARYGPETEQIVYLPEDAPLGRLPGPFVNNPPRAGQVVETQSPTIEWPPATDPNTDSDPAGTLRYRVEINDEDDWAEPPMYTFETLPGVVSLNLADAAYDAQLTRSTWYYRVTTVDQWDEESAASAVQSFVVDANDPPVLSDGSLTPEETGEGSTVTFEVTYTDSDNDPATLVQVVMDNGVTRDMSRVGSPPFDYTAGVQYRVTVAGAVLRAGQRTHHFRASDLPTRDINAWLYASEDPNIDFAGPLVNDPPYPPTSGFDPADGEIAASTRPRIEWDAAEDPNDPDTAGTLQYRIEFSRSGDPFTVEPDYTALSGTGQAFARPATALPAAPSRWYYRVTTIDQWDAESEPSAVQFFQVPESVNNPPTLTWADPPYDNGFDPDTGGRHSTFDFRVVYTDADNDPPDLIRVVIVDPDRTDVNERLYEADMQPVGSSPFDYTAGVVYEAEVGAWNIAIRECQFFFEASDGIIEDPIRLPRHAPNVVRDGPVINDPPRPVTSGFAPARGAVMEEREFEISWDPTTDPNPWDTPETLRYRVEFSRTDSPFTVEDDRTIETDEDETTVDPVVPFTNGTWYWRVIAIDRMNAESDPSAVQRFVVEVVNTPPLVPQPARAYVPADDSIVRVTNPLFSWPDGDDPDPLDTPDLLRYQIQVDISPAFTAPLIDVTTNPGVTEYQVQDDEALELDARYYWRVRTIDPHDAVSGWTEDELNLASPLTFRTLMNSVLQSGAVDPTWGTVDTRFTFTVEYMDEDNLPPAGPIQVVIGPGDVLVRQLTRVATDPRQWADGVTYRTTIRGSELGLGHWNFYFRINTGDPIYEVRTELYGGFVVGVPADISLVDAAGDPTDVYEEGDTIFIVLDDIGASTDEDSPNTVDVTIAEETGVDSQTVTLTETGDHTGIFEGQIGTIGRLPQPGDEGVLNVIAGPGGDVDGNEVTVTYPRPLGAPDVTATAMVIDTTPPAAITAAQLSAQSGPSGITAILNWSDYDEEAQIDVEEYQLWYSTSDFTNIAGATLGAVVPAGTQQGTVPDLSLPDAEPLTPGTQYWFAVTVADEVPNMIEEVETVSTTTVDNDPPYLANEAPAPDATEVPRDTDIVFDVLDDGVGVVENSIEVQVNGDVVTADAEISPVTGGYNVTYQPATFDYNATVEVRVVAEDENGNRMDETYVFHTTTDVEAPEVVNIDFDAEGGTVAFEITDDVSGVDMTTFFFAVNGVERTHADELNYDDSDIMRVRVDYTASDGWAYNTTVEFTVRVADFAQNQAEVVWQEDTLIDDVDPMIDQFNPADGATDVEADTAISARIRDAASGVNTNSVVMTINGVDVSEELDFGLQPAAIGPSQVTATYRPDEPLEWLTDYEVYIYAEDMVGNSASATWSFTTRAEPTYEIRGMITDADGNPLPGVEVEANGSFATSDGNGIYRLRDLTAGTYTVTPTHEDYVFDPPAREEVEIGPTARDQDFRALPRTFTVSGRVTRADDGVAGVRITDGTRTAVTDADGYYELTGVPNGTYTLRPSRDANEDGHEDFTYTPATRNVVVEGADVGDQNFAATARTYSISGRISDNRGDRVAGVTVSDGTRTATTDETGRYTITGVPPGTVTLTPTKAGNAFDPETMDVTVPPDSTGNNFVAYREFAREFGAGLRMIAVPAEPPAGRERAVDVFRTDRVARWNAMATPPTWLMGRQDPDNFEMQVRPGAAFFVQFPAATRVRVPGDPVDPAARFNIGIARGWNQIGNPYENALPLANIGAHAGVQLRPYGFIWDADVGSYRLISRTPALNAARTYIEAWEGAWFRATGSAGNMNIEAPVGVASESLLEGRAARIDSPDNGWVLPIVARVGDRADLSTLAGVGTGNAGEGYTVANPPKAPQTVDVYFTGGDTLLAHDIRPAGADQMVWTFAVETDIANAEVEVTLPDLSAVPHDLAVYLTDLDADRRMYARTLPSYTFTSGDDGALRRFELEVAPRGADNLTIRSATVHGGSQGVVFTYDLSAAASVNVEVLNIAGRKVRELVQSRAVPAGLNELTWDLRSADGTMVPSGNYLIRIEAVAENGQRVQALRPAQVTR